MSEDNAAFSASAYMFDTAEDMISAAKAVSGSGFFGGSAAYSGFGRLFLLVFERSRRQRQLRYGSAYQDKITFDALSGYFTEKKSVGLPGVASEFGKSLPENSDAFIMEHCRCLILSNAINILSSLS